MYPEGAASGTTAATSKTPAWTLVTELVNLLGQPRNTVLDKIGDPIDTLRDAEGYEPDVKPDAYGMMGGHTNGKRYSVYQFYSGPIFKTEKQAPFIKKLGETKASDMTIVAAFEKGSDTLRYISVECGKGKYDLENSFSTAENVSNWLFPKSVPTDFSVQIRNEVISDPNKPSTFVRGWSESAFKGFNVRFFAIDPEDYMIRSTKLNRQTQRMEETVTPKDGVIRWNEAVIYQLYIGDCITEHNQRDPGVQMPAGCLDPSKISKVW